MNALQGKVALVTGGMRGIGKAVVMELAQQGSDIVVCDVDLSNADQISQEIKKLHVQSFIVQADISVVTQVDALVEQALKTFGHIDILVNNAGITRDNLLMRMSEEEWDKVLEINLKGAFLCTKKVIRGMMKQRQGKIINISSVVGLMGNAGQANYAASKGGLIAFGRSIAKEVASRNIQVNTIAPGYIETEMTKSLSQEIKDSFLVDIPAGRPGQPEDIARVVSFLASSASDYVTGEVICVDGGMLIK